MRNDVKKEDGQLKGREKHYLNLTNADLRYRRTPASREWQHTKVNCIPSLHPITSHPDWFFLKVKSRSRNLRVALAEQWQIFWMTMIDNCSWHSLRAARSLPATVILSSAVHLWKKSDTLDCNFWQTHSWISKLPSQLALLANLYPQSSTKRNEDVGNESLNPLKVTPPELLDPGTRSGYCLSVVVRQLNIKYCYHSGIPH